LTQSKRSTHFPYTNCERCVVILPNSSKNTPKEGSTSQAPPLRTLTQESAAQAMIIQTSIQGTDA